MAASHGQLLLPGRIGICCQCRGGSGCSVNAAAASGAAEIRDGSWLGCCGGVKVGTACWQSLPPSCSRCNEIPGASTLLPRIHVRSCYIENLPTGRE